MNIYKKNGKLEVVCGSMFSGKTEELIKRLKRAMFRKQSIQVFKHSADSRYSSSFIFSHTGNKISSLSVQSSSEIIDSVSEETEVVGIDEIQFFDMDIILAMDYLVRKGKSVIVAGLDLDFRGIPFGPIPYLMAIADEVTKLKAVCCKSGKDAYVSQRIINGKPAKYNDPVIMIGANDFYEARSRDHFEIDEVPLEKYLYNK